MEGLDLTNYHDFGSEPKDKTIIAGTFRLDKNTLINILSKEAIKVGDHYYKVPEQKILQLLLYKQFGDTYLELEREEYNEE